MDERRKYPRVRMDRRALFATLTDADDGQVHDISRGGMLIATEAACHAMLNQTLVVHLPGLGLQCEAVVTRYLPRESIAVRFARVNDPDTLRRVCVGGAA